MSTSTSVNTSGTSVVSSFAYTLAANGRRDAVLETYQDASQTLQNAIVWAYDALDRLTSESLDFNYNPASPSIDRTAHFTYDLANNRLTQSTDFDGDASAGYDEHIVYTYDHNNRLLRETGKLVAGVPSTTEYHYGSPGNPANPGTDLTHHITYQADLPATVLSESTTTFDACGRMIASETQTQDPAGHDLLTQNTFAYDDADHRVASTETTTLDDDGNPQTDPVIHTTRTVHVVDDNNLTGYSQILETYTRTTAPGSPDPGTPTPATDTSAVTYFIAGDILAQTTPASSNLQTSPPVTLWFLTDAQGSTRQLAAADSGQIVQAASAPAPGSGPVTFLVYDAFGNALNFAAGTAATVLLYTGEAFTEAGIGNVSRYGYPTLWGMRPHGNPQGLEQRRRQSVA